MAGSTDNAFMATNRDGGRCGTLGHVLDLRDAVVRWDAATRRFVIGVRREGERLGALGAVARRGSR